jgi:hypothetical protein
LGSTPFLNKKDVFYYINEPFGSLPQWAVEAQEVNPRRKFDSVIDMQNTPSYQEAIIQIVCQNFESLFCTAPAFLWKMVIT